MFENNPSLIQEAPPSAPWVRITPLVLIHDGGGTTFSYYCLGNLDRPVYGIANPHYQSGEPWEDGLPGMARHYAKLIKSTISRGKVILGGWSLGGLVSLEVSRILAEDPALHIIGIVMIDSICPINFKTPSLPVVQHAMEWSPHTRQETRDAILRCFADAGKMVSTWALPTWGDERKANDAPREAADNNNKTATLRSSQAPLFTPRLVPPPVILLRATELVPVDTDGVSRVDIHRIDPHLGWDNYRDDLISQATNLPGCHHFNIFTQEATLDDVTEKLKKACRDLEARTIVRYK